MSYLPRYVFNGNKHVIKHLQREKTEYVIIELKPKSLWFVLLFNFELYLVLHFFNECELIDCSSLNFKPGDQRFHCYSLQRKLNEAFVRFACCKKQSSET